MFIFFGYSDPFYRAAQTQLDRSDSRYLLQELLEVSTAWMLAHDDEVMPSEKWERYKDWVHQAKADVPIPYILGYTWFYGRKFSVSPAENLRP